MALKIETTIRDFAGVACLDGLEDDEIELLTGLEEDGIPVEVVAEATDGYFDVVLPSGKLVNALSWVHLDGFNENGPVL
jgi:hypothetical protein